MGMTEDEARALAAQLGHPKGEDGIEVGQRMHSTNINMIRKSAAALELRPGESLIEIGHGSGAHVPELLQKYKTLSYSGLEISSTMHEQAKDGNRGFSSQAKFKLYDGQSLPMDDDSADAILTVNSIYFWKKPEALFREFHRVLRPDGRVAIGLGEKEFMETLPVVKHGFTTYNRQDLLKVLAGTGLVLKDFQDHNETVESNMNGLVDRKFHVALLGLE